MPDTLIQPAHLWVPEHDRTLGPEVVDLAALAGLTLDGEQRLAADAICAVRPDGQWAAFEAGVVCSRQNLKTFLLEALALADLFLFDCELVVWTAHLFDTAQESFRHFEQMIDGCAHLSREVKTIHRARGDEGIELMSGARLNFMARSKSAGRGLSGDSVTLDEAFALGPTEMGALLPTTSARPNPQVRYGSSAGMRTSDVLRGIRDRGRAGGDPSLAYLEWCAPTGGCDEPNCDHRLDARGCALDDPEMWRLANPAMGRRIAEERIAAERRALPPKEFARERLGWWDDPPPSTGGAIDLTAWLLLADPDVAIGKAPVFGLDVGEDRSCSLGVVWKRADGRTQIELVATWPDTREAVVRTADALTKREGRLMLGGAAESLAGDLTAAGVTFEVISSKEFAQGCGLMDDGIRAGTLRHANQPELNEAARTATWRSVGTAGERAWKLKDSPSVGPLAAVTRALHGLTSGNDTPPNLW